MFMLIYSLCGANEAGRNTSDISSEDLVLQQINFKTSSLNHGRTVLKISVLKISFHIVGEPYQLLSIPRKRGLIIRTRPQRVEKQFIPSLLISAKPSICSIIPSY